MEVLNPYAFFKAIIFEQEICKNILSSIQRERLKFEPKQVQSVDITPEFPDIFLRSIPVLHTKRFRKFLMFF